jgi:hypothetical protein
MVMMLAWHLLQCLQADVIVVTLCSCGVEWQLELSAFDKR